MGSDSIDFKIKGLDSLILQDLGKVPSLLASTLLLWSFNDTKFVVR